jgi:hypothetical protein
LFVLMRRKKQMDCKWSYFEEGDMCTNMYYEVVPIAVAALVVLGVFKLATTIICRLVGLRSTANKLDEEKRKCCLRVCTPICIRQTRTNRKPLMVDDD